MDHQGSADQFGTGLGRCWADPAGTDVDRTNNCEQVQVNDPVAGAWTIRVTAHSLNEPVDDPVCNNMDPKAETWARLTELLDEDVREAIIDSIEAIDERGYTSISAGLELGETLLAGAAADQPHAMVLLTDGFENTPPWVRERPPGFEYYSETPNNILDDIPIATDIYTI
jgi:hypothetical protein